MEYSIEDGLAKLAADGAITDQEQEFLLATYQATQSPDSPLTKSAGKKMDYLLQEVGLGNMLLAGAAATPLVGMGVNYALNPVREAMRYRNMQQLPNAHAINLSRTQSRSFYVPEDDDEKQMSESAIRKAFAILHRYAPEITRTPELAHNFLHENTGNGVEQFVTNAVGYARNPVEVSHKREQMADWKRSHIRNTANGLKVILDPLNPKPVVQTLAERVNEMKAMELAKAEARYEANQLYPAPPRSGGGGGGGGGGVINFGGRATPRPLAPVRMGPSAGGAIAAGILGNRRRGGLGAAFKPPMTFPPNFMAGVARPAAPTPPVIILTPGPQPTDPLVQQRLAEELARRAAAKGGNP